MRHHILLINSFLIRHADHHQICTTSCALRDRCTSTFKLVTNLPAALWSASLATPSQRLQRTSGACALETRELARKGSPCITKATPFHKVWSVESHLRAQRPATSLWLSCAGVSFHRIIPNFMIQVGKVMWRTDPNVPILLLWPTKDPPSLLNDDRNATAGWRPDRRQWHGRRIDLWKQVWGVIQRQPVLWCFAKLWRSHCSTTWKFS